MRRVSDFAFSIIPAVLLFTFVVVVLMISHGNAMANCHRINDSIAESNMRIPAHVAEKAVIHDFLTSAREARFANWRETHQTSDLKAGLSYSNDITRLQRVRFHRIKPINCDKAIHFLP